MIAKVRLDRDGSLSLTAALKALGARGVTRVLVEGGGRIAAALLRFGLVDRLVWFHGPRIIGGDGIHAVTGFGLEALEEAPAFAPGEVLQLGDDLMETYLRRD